MDWDDQKVKQALTDAINRQLPGRTDSQQITAIIWANDAHGRLRNFLDLAKEHQPADYVARVVQNYERYHHYVDCVQNGDEEIWDELYPKMQKWAYRYLLKKGFFPGSMTQESAVSFAGDAGAVLIHAHYPYDFDVFDAWAYQILVNVCRRQMRQAKNQVHVPERQLVNLDSAEIREFATIALDYLSENALDLEQAFTKLTEREQNILLWFLNGFGAEEIAAKFGTTVNNIYRIKHVIIKN